MVQLILHHYDFSNYSEKVRVAMGFKALDWASVTIPPVLPKPDLVGLTGGYRRAPVLQIGADIYCDTRLILRELEARAPDPTLYPAGLRGIANAISAWAEGQLFRPVMLYAWGTNHDVMPKELFADRAAMRGMPVPSVNSVTRAAARNAPLMRIQLPLIEEMLTDRGPWICGKQFTVADLALYHAMWFVTDRTERLSHELTPYRALQSWMARVRDLGHGRAQPMTAAEALVIARSSSPLVPGPSKPQPEDPALGAAVQIRAADYAQDIVRGTLAFVDDDEIALRMSNAEVGEVVVHFPRIGFEFRAARPD
jgi:glutathione S-transferase